MKITLDAKALEAMIGGDSEVEVELRNAIVQEFTKKYLKGIVNDKIIGTIEMQIRNEMTGNRSFIENVTNEYLKEKFNYEGSYWNKTPVIKEEYKTKIRSEVEIALGKVITETVEGYKQKLEEKLEYYKSYYDKQLETKLADYINEKANKIVAEKISAIISGVK